MNKGFFTEYARMGPSLQRLQQEKRKQLSRIAEIRRRDLLVYAADHRKQARDVNTMIDSEDLFYVQDQLAALSKRGIDIILHTQGGSAEAAEDIVRLVRKRFKWVGFIIPAYAKSAGTIMVMSGDDILMDEASSLGPIDAQVFARGKTFSADAFLKGIDQIKREAVGPGGLNRAYIPMLQGISPAEIEMCENAQQLAKKLVKDWLVQYKFRRWRKHSSTGKAVTPRQKQKQAEQIASALCNQSLWKTHSRSIKIENLRSLGLKVTDYSKRKALCEAIRRYHVLMQMTFDLSPVYKIFETPNSGVERVAEQARPGQPGLFQMHTADFPFRCPQCGARIMLQANLGQAWPLKPGFTPFPKNNKLKCPRCNTEHSLQEARKRIEKQAGLPIV
jgi:hypothetical protein